MRRNPQLARQRFESRSQLSFSREPELRIRTLAQNGRHAAQQILVSADRMEPLHGQQQRAVRDAKVAAERAAPIRFHGLEGRGHGSVDHDRRIGSQAEVLREIAQTVAVERAARRIAHHSREPSVARGVVVPHVGAVQGQHVGLSVSRGDELADFDDESVAVQMNKVARLNRTPCAPGHPAGRDRRANERPARSIAAAPRHVHDTVDRRRMPRGRRRMRHVADGDAASCQFTAEQHRKQCVRCLFWWKVRADHAHVHEWIL